MGSKMVSLKVTLKYSRLLFVDGLLLATFFIPNINAQSVSAETCEEPVPPPADCSECSGQSS
jgi:hypothetical protein